MRVFRGNSSVGRARPCQGRGREFESRFPLQVRKSPVRRGFFSGFRAAPHGVTLAPRLPAGWQSGYAADCKSAYAGSIPTSASSLETTSPRRGFSLARFAPTSASSLEATSPRRGFSLARFTPTSASGLETTSPRRGFSLARFTPTSASGLETTSPRRGFFHLARSTPTSASGLETTSPRRGYSLARSTPIWGSIVRKPRPGGTFAFHAAQASCRPTAMRTSSASEPASIFSMIFARCCSIVRGLAPSS
jgi:hypothetical protein